MADYIISCCSTVDTSRAWLAEKDIKAVYFHFHLGEDHYFDDFYESVSPGELFSRMLAGESCGTSQVNAEEYLAHWKPYLESGQDVLHLTLSSGISGTYNSAAAAAEQAREQYPDRKIYAIDSLCASGGYGLICDKAAELRDQGMTIDELRDWLEAHKLDVQHLVMTTDLTFLIRGGRVSKAAGIFGKALNICPYIEVDDHGALAVRDKIRTKKRIMNYSLNNMKERFGPKSESRKVYIGHSERPEDAEALRQMVMESFPDLPEEPRIYPIGATIGCHTGPGTLTLFFFGEGARS